MRFWSWHWTLWSRPPAPASDRSADEATVEEREKRYLRKKYCHACVRLSKAAQDAFVATHELRDAEKDIAAWAQLCRSSGVSTKDPQKGEID